MSMVTRCPHCATAFRVTPQQLQAHQGQVRCGRCGQVFDAFAALLAAPEAPAEETAAPAGTPVAEKTQGGAMPRPDPLLDYAPVPVMPERKPRAWPWAAGSLLLLLALLGQGAHFFRSELAARHPALKPLLQSYCRALQCTVGLPQNPQLLNIESSDLQAADSSRPGLIVLNAVLHNRAATAMAFPALELTLTDAQDRAAARRVFMPEEYLGKDANVEGGMAANGEASLKLYLDTGELQAAGYRLYLFYP